MKLTAFWDAAPCRVAKLDRRFRGVYYLHHQGDLRIENVGTSETCTSARIHSTVSHKSINYMG
jgi:hypothetical protein